MSEKPLLPAGYAVEQWEKLKTEHQPRAFDHEKASMALEVEQGRLITYGSLGALAVTWTCVFQNERPICLPYVETGSSLLLLAAVFGSTALSFMSAAHSNRSRFETEQMMFRHRVLTGEEVATSDKDGAATGLDDTHKARNVARLLTLASTWLALAAFPILYSAAAQTITNRCRASFWSDAASWLAQTWPF